MDELMNEICDLRQEKAVLIETIRILMEDNKRLEEELEIYAIEEELN